MPSYVMRIWLADRPGALGNVASVIGDTGGDLVGIDILERGDGRAIDELTIELTEQAVPQLLQAVSAIEGVDIEDLRAVVAGLPHPLLDPLEVAARTLHSESVGDLFGTFVAGIAQTFSDWAALVDPDGSVVLASSPGAPADAWLGAFVAGTRSASPVPGAAGAANDVAWATLEISGLALLVGRTGRPFRARERRQLSTLALIADHRWRELVMRDSMRAHPSRPM
jgi:hypothetical protein